METNVLIPTQEKFVAIEFIKFAKDHFKLDFKICLSIARRMIDNRYWEAKECENESRAEYWRVVNNCCDGLTEEDI